MSQTIYLDHAATTPLRDEVRAAMEPFLSDRYGNASSVHRFGQEARAALDRARDVIAECMGAQPSEIVFTSGGTESNNAALFGACLAGGLRGGHLVTTSIEHHAVLHPAEDLRDLFGMELTIVPVGSNGIVDPAVVERAIRPDTVLVSVMSANNETGTIQPVEEIARITRERGTLLHVDAVQAAGHIPVDLSTVPIDLLSISAHKFYGPKGVGALFVRRGTPWRSCMTGGAQERNRRAGTENVAGIVGMARALELACAEREEVRIRLTALRDRLLEGLCLLPGVHVNGVRRERLPNNVNVSFDGAHGESVLVALDLAGIMASSGSACTSGTLEPSHVLLALGRSEERARNSLRLTLGRDTTEHEIDRTLTVIAGILSRLRDLAPAGAR